MVPTTECYLVTIVKLMTTWGHDGVTSSTSKSQKGQASIVDRRGAKVTKKETRFFFFSLVLKREENFFNNLFFQHCWKTLDSSVCCFCHLVVTCKDWYIEKLWLLLSVTNFLLFCVKMGWQHSQMKTSGTKNWPILKSVCNIAIFVNWIFIGSELATL